MTTVFPGSDGSTGVFRENAGHGPGVRRVETGLVFQLFRQLQRVVDHCDGHRTVPLHCNAERTPKNPVRVIQRSQRTVRSPHGLRVRLFINAAYQPGSLRQGSGQFDSDPQSPPGTGSHRRGDRIYSSAPPHLRSGELAGNSSSLATAYS